ncbi:hypothetical protein GCM10023340_19820 [Nocardioides marinquilinus]|uniref:AbiEi antitoxin C-terminal domain-containing protein n=1 Tax=Nocardioides marinquilinus TaxID=1210400 RepID=A0ABP9PNY8_9ACTN
MFEPEPWHPARPGLFRPAPLDPTGEHGPTRSQAQGPRVRRTSHGLYVPAWVEPTTAQRIVEAAALTRGGQCVTGWASLCWRGARWFTGTDAVGRERPVELLVSTRDLRPRPGITVTGEGIAADQREVVDGVQLVDVRAAVSFLMRRAASVREAVRVLDMAAYDDVVSVAEMDGYLSPGQNSWTGVPRARAAVPLCSEASWSPAEVDLRLTWVLDGGFPAPLVNAPVFDAEGRHVATPDLIDVEAGVAGEYEGGIHLDRATRAADVRREAALRAHDLEVVTMTADDRLTPRRFLARLEEAYHRAGRRRGARSWTTDPPSWWTPTATVAQRRALTPDQRRRFLRYRAS